jgi:hypothetical protein
MAGELAYNMLTMTADLGDKKRLLAFCVLECVIAKRTFAITIDESILSPCMVNRNVA